MNAATLIRRVAEAGITLKLVDGKLIAKGSQGTDVADLLSQLREHKNEVINELAAANDSQTTGQQQPYAGDHADLPTNLPVCDGVWPNGPAWTQTEINTYQSRYAAFIEHGMSEHEAERMADASIFSDRLHGGNVRPVATPERPSPAKPAKVKHIDKSWKPLALEYYEHHFKCPFCISAGKGARYGLKCGTGATLWALYQKASEECESRKE